MTGSVIITDNPNHLSTKAYDGKTQYLGFLGWALPAAGYGNCADTASLSSLVATSQISGSVSLH